MLNISNYKYSVKLEKLSKTFFKDIEINFFESLKRVNNFIVLRFKWVFILFQNGHVNITKIKNKKDIADAIQFLTTKICPGSCIRHIKIDNLTATGHIKNVSLSAFKDKNLTHLLRYHNTIDFRKKIAIEWEFSTFPAIKIFADVGTALLFYNGKINLVGFKSEKLAYWLYNQLNQIINGKPKVK